MRTGRRGGVVEWPAAGGGGGRAVRLTGRDAGREKGSLRKALTRRRGGVGGGRRAAARRGPAGPPRAWCGRPAPTRPRSAPPCRPAELAPHFSREWEPSREDTGRRGHLNPVGVVHRLLFSRESVPDFLNSSCLGMIRRESCVGGLPEGHANRPCRRAFSRVQFFPHLFGRL